MFVRFQQSQFRLTAVLADSRREGGRVVNEHIACLGSVRMPPSIEGRVAFWTKANERIARLANRIGPDLDKIMGRLNARIPMPTPDEQRTLAALREEIRDIPPMSRSDKRHCLELVEIGEIADRIGANQDEFFKHIAHKGADLGRKAMTRRLLKGLRATEANRIDEMVAKLAAQGIECDAEDVFELLEQKRLDKQAAEKVTEAAD